MSWGRSKRVAVIIGVLLAFTMGTVGWAQQEAPSGPSQREGQSGSGMMGPGMMEPGMMGSMMPMMGDTRQMIQTCTQMMNQMMSQASGPSQPQPGTPAPKSETK